MKKGAQAPFSFYYFYPLTIMHEFQDVLLVHQDQ